MPSETSDVLRVIDLTKLSLSLPTQGVCKKNFETLASYNWLDKDTPTILVPGSPARWTPQPPGTQLSPDTGAVVTDQNGYRNPEYPLEPLFRALFTEKPDFDLSDIDLVTNRGGLLRLFGSISGDTRHYTTNVQRIGKTTLFTRTEGGSSSYVEHARHGYGHSFEKAYTEWPAGIENSICHYRIARYQFCGVRCMVRFEVDASTHNESDGLLDVSNEPSSLLTSISLDTTATICESKAFSVIKGGISVPHSSILELKTKQQDGRSNSSRVLTQAWFSATPSVVVGCHRGGRFDDIKTARMDTGDLDAWENRNAAKLAKLAALIKIIIEEAGKAEGGRCLVCSGPRGILTITGTSSRNDVLPGDLKAKFS